MLKRSLALSVLCTAHAAFGQTAASSSPTATPGGGAGATSGAAPAAPAEPQLPSVSDEMLDAPPPAANVLQSWQDALRVLRANSTTLRTLAARVDISRAQSRQALAGFLPTLSGNAGITRHLLRGERSVLVPTPPFQATVTVPDPATTWNAGLQLRVPVVALETWNDRAIAEAGVEVARLNTKAAERLAIAAVADAVVTSVTAERLAEVSRVSLESALSTLDLYKRRAALGAASAIDVLRGEQEVSLSRGQIITANDGVLRAREALGAALGSADPYGVTPTIKLDALAADAKTSCTITTDILGRADVRAAQASLNVSKRSADGVSRRYWPTVDAVSNLTYWSHESSTPNNESVTWTVGGVLNWTLYDGGLRYGTREQRAAEARVASEQLSETKRRARLEVTQSFRAVRAAEATLSVSRKTRELAAETARLSKVAYLSGSGTSFDLVDTARRQREAELDYTIKEFEVLRAKIAALLALATCDV